MAADLLLGVRLTSVEEMRIVTLNNVNLKEKVEKLRTKTAGQINLTNDSFDLVYCGCLLENDSTMESYGLKNGSMIHVLKKKENKEKAPTTMEEVESNAEKLTSVFTNFITNSLLVIAMRRLTKKPEFIENIISATPELKDDPVAIAILQDPDLIVHFTNYETMKKIAKHHPALLEAAQHLAVAVHSEAHSFIDRGSLNSSSTSAQTSGPSYNLERLSDDEEMAGDSSQSSDSTQPSNSVNESRNQSSPLITASQLLAALTRTQRSTSTSGGNSGNASSPLSSISRTNSNSGGAITFEMFDQAMQQAFASVPAANNFANFAQTPSSTSFTMPQSMNLPNDMQRQITIMHEMGLQNDAINLQALQITNGDVQAAIELVLNGFGDN